MVYSLIVWALAFVMPTFAWAHAFGEPVQLPMPYELYIQGATLALVLSFVLLALAGRRSGGQPPHLLLGWPVSSENVIARQRLAGRVFWLLALSFCVLTGLLGTSDSHRNINMTFFWIVFLLAGAYACTLVGNWFAHQNPFLLLVPRHWKPLAR
ncbi:MAG: hypothetical protein R3194_13610, partial [Limnobacter sp.]|nr:hypothetical protein [Limnobacter sp.]